MGINETISALLDARRAKSKAENDIRTLSAAIIERAAGSRFFETDDYHVTVVDKSRTDLDQAALIELFPDLKEQFPKHVTWKEIRAAALTDAEKAARKLTA
jgi:hypothetical protein